MSDLERLARAEERIEALVKRVDRLDDAIGEQFDDLKASLKETINGRIKEVEAKNILVRGIVFGACAIILTAFLGAVVAWFIGAGVRPVPALPQPYTIQPRSR